MVESLKSRVADNLMNRLLGEAVSDRAIVHHWTVFLLLMMFLLGRLLLFLGIGPQLYFDSQTYVAPAIAMLENHGYDDFSFWDGSRTPVYPVFLAIVFALFGKSNYQAVVSIQILLGAISTVILYYLGYRISRDRRIAFLSGLVYVLDVSSAAFEHAVLTETLSTVLLLGTLLLIWDQLEGTQPAYWRVALLGLLAGLLALCRPVFVLYPFLLLSVLLFAFRVLGNRNVTRSRIAGLLTVFFLPAALLIGSWIFRNFVMYDYLGISTLLGSNLTQHVGMVMERAPERYSDLAHIYVEYRQQRIEQTGTHVFTVGYAYEEMMDRTGLRFSQLSKVLTKLSISLIVREPKLYIKSVVRSFMDFWSPTVYYNSQVIRGESLFKFAHSAYRTWHFSMLLGFFVGVVYVIAVVDLLGPNRDYILLYRPALMIGIIVVTVFYVAVVSSVLEHGENARYKAPVQPLIYLTVPLAYWYRQMAHSLESRCNVQLG